MRLLFDIETDGLMPHQTKPGEKAGTKVHCIVIRDLDTNVVHLFSGSKLRDGLEMLAAADEVYGHNIIFFDLPFLEMVYPDFRLKPCCKVCDTLVASRLIFTNLKDLDIRKRLVAGRLIGSHSLEAWGLRLKCHKGSFGKQTDWSKFSPEMLDYCVQDVAVNLAILQMILSKNYSERALTLEMRFAQIISLQERRGFAFDVQAAQKLYATLQTRREVLRDRLQTVFAPTVTEMKTPEYWLGDGPTGAVNKYTTKTEAKHCSAINIRRGPNKKKVVPFNPGSRLQIGERLKSLGWTPAAFTEDGQAKIDDEILSALPYPEAKLLSEYLMVEKRIGQIAEGDEAWLRLERNGRIHGKVNTGGAVTGRCTHSNPNVAQTPKADPDVPYGVECRSLFTASPGFVLVGCDAEGLELRGLSHFMAHYDGGAYGQTVLNGKKEDKTDIHSVNQRAAGLPSRDVAKTFIYAFIYGAGDLKLGTIVGVTLEEANVLRTQYPKLWQGVNRTAQRLASKGLPMSPLDKARSLKGAVLREKFLKGLPALGQLIAAVKTRARENKWIKGLDGRLLFVRSMHSCLNTLIQSAGAVVMKKATVILYDKCVERGWVWGRDWAQVGSIHDEIQSEVRPEIAEEFREMAEKSITEAGEFFGFRCRLDGSASIGKTWRDTH